jgi:hypothetical protein
VFLETRPQVARIADRVIQDFLEANIVLLVVLAREATNADAGCYSVYDLAPIREFSARLTLESCVPTDDFLQRSENVAIEKKSDDFVSDGFQ